MNELAVNPGASMEDLAQAAGLVRRTLYGHFPNRDALVDALVTLVVRDALRIATETRLDEGEPPLTLAVFTMRSWRLVDDYPALLALANRAPTREFLRRRLVVVRRQVAGLILRGQRSQVFAADVSPVALAMMCEAIQVSTMEAVTDHILDRAGGPRVSALGALRVVGVPADESATAVKRAEGLG